MSSYSSLVLYVPPNLFVFFKPLLCSLSLYGFLQIKEESIMDGSRMSLKDDLGVTTAIVGEVEVHPPPATRFWPITKVVSNSCCTCRCRRFASCKESWRRENVERFLNSANFLMATWYTKVFSIECKGCSWCGSGLITWLLFVRAYLASLPVGWLFRWLLVRHGL